MEQLMNTLPDSVYEQVKHEDLIQNEVYIKLAHDGWYSNEIKRIMDHYLKHNRSKVKGSYAYGMYAKQWLPTYGYTPGGDSIYQFTDSAFTGKAIASVRSLYANALQNYDPQIPYTPTDRMQKKRNKGYFRPVLQEPNTGRIHWIVVDPLNADHIMVVPDGAGIFRTADLGKTWDCVTDRIPDREFRKICTHSAVPVDPDDWNHFFAFMANGNTTAVYETQDGGQSWARVEGATHKGFKRGYAFKDAAGNLKFIGAKQSGNYMNNELWTSADKGVHWDRITLPEELKEVHPENGSKGAFFQNFAFNPKDRNMVYIPTSRSIYYFDDGVTPTTENGVKTYHIKKMKFDVLAADGSVRAKGVTEFPFKATSQGFLEIDPNDPNKMWFAAGSRNVSYGVHSAVYKSEDGGKTWKTLQETLAGIGRGLAFGNESPWGWLGGFGVNFKNPNYLYGCSMSSAISSDGGVNFKEFGWGNRLKADHNGSYYYTTSSRHNADNHCIVSHASGRVFRGSDSGLLMVDEDVNGNYWTNINGSMGNQLHYSIKVNEFGDQIMLGNTQDVDVQTYKYGRWENWRGYEGTEAFINPYGGTCYFSGGGGGGLEGIEFSSWRQGFTQADVCTGYWYLQHDQSSGSFFRIEDFGNQTINITPQTADNTGKGAGVKNFGLARTPEGTSVLYVYNKNNTVVRSTDNGESFETVQVKGSNGSLVNATFSDCCLAVDPNQPDIVYLGQSSRNNQPAKVIRINVKTHEYEEVATGLPKVSCWGLFFHEGAGDLYFWSSAGIYLLEKNATQWQLWMRGYNPLVVKSMALNYTTQEMVLGDYGRGVWVADLQNPSDRYFSDGFALKEISNIDGRVTLGIDTKWTIPMYYEYTWTVNGVDQKVPFQYLTARLKENDQVQLKLTLRESPDVTTTSAVYVVGSDKLQKQVPAKTLTPKAGKALYSDGNGRVDLGYVDYFYNDFSIDFWIKPESNGVVLANRPVDVEKDTRGWAILVENKQLKFRYAPANLVNRPSYENAFDQQKDLVITELITFGEWYHVTLTEDRDGQISFFLNGVLKAQEARIRPEHTLNAAVYLSLFADGYERRPIKATVDELRIWDKTLTESEVRRAMYSYDLGCMDHLVYYQDFNQGDLSQEREYFSQLPMRSRTRAVTSYVDMPLGVAAKWADVRPLSGRTVYQSGEHTMLTLTGSQQNDSHEVAVYQYDALGNQAIPGLSLEHYHMASDLYLIHSFQVTGMKDSLTLEIPGNYQANTSYFLYVADMNRSQKEWKQVAQQTLTQAGTTLEFKDISMSELQNKYLVVLSYQAAIDARLRTEGAGNDLYIYDKADMTYGLDVFTVGGLREPVGDYVLRSQRGHLLFLSPLHFENGKASTTFSVDARTLTQRITEDCIVAQQDESFIPLNVRIHNCILPQEAGNCAQIEWGGLINPDLELTKKLAGSNTMTMMGWFKLDDASMLKGVRPLMFFRGGSPNVCGLHLADGNLRFHWNDTWYNWASDLTLTQKDLGRWVHLALVVAPDYISVFLNGQEYRHSRITVPGAKITTPFLLGQNNQGDTWFKGSIDQVSLWKKSLTADEIRHYMFETPKLNTAGLLSYVDMDYRNEENLVLDQVSERSLKNVGKVSFAENIQMPYHFKEQYVQLIKDGEDASKLLYLQQPIERALGCTFSVINGNSYNFASTEHPELYPFLPQHFLLNFHARPKFIASDVLKLLVHIPEITGNNALTLAMRPVGSTSEFTTFVKAQKVEAGRAEFVLPTEAVTESVELMLMLDAGATVRPDKVEVKVFNWNQSKQVQDGETLFLNENEDEIIIRTRVTSRNPQSHVLLSIVEQDYAPFEKELDIANKIEETFVVQLNRDNLQLLEENPITIRLNGVTENSDFTFKVAFTPVVKLSYKNELIPDNHHIIVDSVFHTEDIQAHLVRGVLKEEVQLAARIGNQSAIGAKVQSDESNLKMSFNTNIGTLVSNDIVRIKDPIAYFKSANTVDEGWNLVGNPYLANLNLTKRQNVQFDETGILKFMYEYDPETDTYRAWDMIDHYDASQVIRPLQAFFIIARQPDAELVITSEAKNSAINRRVFDHFNLEDMKLLELTLKGDSGKVADHTEIRIASEAHSEFVVGEDAVKLWGGMNEQSNEIATQVQNTHAAINVVPDRYIEVPIYLRLSKKGAFTLNLSKAEGFNDGKHQIVLYDKKLKSYHNFLLDNSYQFVVEHPNEATTRFSLTVDVRHQSSIDQHEVDKCITPTSDGVHISGLEGISTIEIFDAVGRRFDYETTNSGEISKVLRSGTYIVHVRTKNYDYSKKIVIK